MNKLTSLRVPFAEALDYLLIDIAVRVQLSDTNYNLAVSRANTIQEHIERDGSPLEGRVQLFHAQGSMSIGTTISSRLDNDEFDIDLIAVVDLPADTPPHRVLDILELAIRGEPGSRYYDKTERRTRCIQVLYSDMHLDITPMVRLPALPEKCGLIFHAPERYKTADDAAVLANPWGFTQHFRARTPPEREFLLEFADRAKAYDRSIRMDAEVEPVPDQEPVHAKSLAVVGAQLTKRFRNVRYDRRTGRCPPSVMMAKVVADNAGQTRTLSEELIFQATQLRNLLASAQWRGELVDVRNPTCRDDCFTDRWPEDLRAQQLFIDDLDYFIEKLESLRGEADLMKMRTVLADLFGERVALEAVKGINRVAGGRVVDGVSQHIPGAGRIVLPTPAQVAALGVPSMAAVPAIARATPKHTNFGSEPPK